MLVIKQFWFIVFLVQTMKVNESVC